MVSRLGSTAPDILLVISELSAATRMEVVTRVVRWAAEEVGLDRSRIEAAISGSTPEWPKEAAREFDDHYFELEEQGSPMHMALFVKARAASALAFLLEQNSEEAVYEAIAATELAGVRRITTEAMSVKGLTLHSSGSHTATAELKREAI